MNIITYGLIYLIILTSQHVNNKVITINTTGSDSIKCCVKGECPCSSLSTALHSMTSNTVINITSQSVTLHSKVTMGSGHLTNIAIVGNGATIMCNNRGSVECYQCSGVIIKGITWDKSGPDHKETLPIISFRYISNIMIADCVFQHSRIMAVNLFGISGNVIVDQCKFLSNKRNKQFPYGDVGGLTLDCFDNTTANVTIHQCHFYDNGYYGELQYDDDFDGYALLILCSSFQISVNITISKTQFFNNAQVANIDLTNFYESSLTLYELIAYNNHVLVEGGTLFDIGLDSENGNMDLMILSSVFSSNTGTVLSAKFHTRGDIAVVVKDTVFTSNTNYHSPIIDLTFIRYSVDYCFRGSLYFNDVVISNNSLLSGKYNSPIASIISIRSPCIITNVTMNKVNVTSNVCHYNSAGTVYIKNPAPSVITLRECLFLNNTSVHGAAIYIDGLLFLLCLVCFI